MLCTIYQTDKDYNRVKGLATALPEHVIKALDAFYKALNFSRQAMFVKPTDLGPLYRPPFRAWAYVLIPKHEAPMIMPHWQVLKYTS